MNGTLDDEYLKRTEDRQTDALYQAAMARVNAKRPAAPAAPSSPAGAAATDTAAQKDELPFVPMSSREAMDAYSRQLSQLPQGIKSPVGEPAPLPPPNQRTERAPVLTGQGPAERPYYPPTVAEFKKMFGREPQQLKELEWFQNVERIKKTDPKEYKKLQKIWANR